MAVIMLIGFIALIALPSVLWLYALADVIINSFREFITKIIWILVLCFFPPLGTVLYFLIGRNQRTTYYPVGRVIIISILVIPIVMIIAYFLYSIEHMTFIPEPPKSMQIQI
jgi:hypothetical protein